MKLRPEASKQEITAMNDLLNVIGDKRAQLMTEMTGSCKYRLEISNVRQKMSPHVNIRIVFSSFKTLAVSRYNGRDNDGNNYYRFILQQTFVIFIALTCLYHVSSLSVLFEINVRTFVVREHKSLMLLCLTINCNTYSLKKKRIMHLNVF